MSKKGIAKPAWQNKLQQKAKEAQDTLTTLRENGSGGERQNIPFRPYKETGAELKLLAATLQIERDEIVKVHDLLIEAVNDLFKKYNWDHVAERPTRAKK